MRAWPVAYAALVLVLTSLSAVAAPGPAASDGASADADTQARKARAIHQLIQLSDSAELEAIFSKRFISRVTDALSLFQPAMDPQTLAVVAQESRAVIHEHIASGDALYSVLYPVYARHFNLIELSKLVTFYQSPLGQKLVRVSPQLLTESLDLGSDWALSLLPEILQRVQTRLKADPGPPAADSLP